MSGSKQDYDVRADWPTVVPLGDSLAVGTNGGFDERWLEAFEVVVDEHERVAVDRGWDAIGYKFSNGEGPAELKLVVRHIEAGVQPAELRRTVEDLVAATNTVAAVGTHVYDLARELRQAEQQPEEQPEQAGPRSSVPPPSRDPLEDELAADVA